MDLEEAIAALRRAEPRNIPGHLPMDVSIVPRPNGGWRASFAWRHDAGSGPLLVRGSAELIEGRLTITELCLDVAKTEPADVAEDEFWQELGPPTARIDAATYRSIPIGTLTESVRREVLAKGKFDDLARMWGQPVEPSTLETRQRAATAVAGKTLRRGRRGYGDDHYRDVAQAAMRHHLQGNTPVRAALAKEFRVSESTVRDWLRRARRLGWLAPAEPGRRGVEPGPRLLEEDR